MGREMYSEKALKTHNSLLLYCITETQKIQMNNFVDLDRNKPPQLKKNTRKGRLIFFNYGDK